MVNPDSEEEFNSDFQNFLESDSLSNSEETVRSERGDNGMRGLRGLRGITGPQGVRGDAGAKGDAGDTGKQGEQGERGEKGEAGPQGIQGPQGISGVAGAVGEKGDKGDRGQQGLKGDNGPEGVQGAQGEVGKKGDRGEKGEQGAQGVKGEKGDTGERGEQGKLGVDGVVGQDGLQGEKGERGAQGVRGEKGEIGVKGDRGADGSAGAQGDKGATGEQGATGDSGIVTAKYPLKYDPKKKIISIDTTRLGGGSVSKDGGGGGLDTAFKTVSVSGQSDLNAVQYAAETLSIVAGSNITLTTDSATNSLTISSSGGGGTAGGVQGATGATGSQGVQGGNAGRIYYLWAGVTADVAGYKTASTSPSPNAITSITTTVTGTSDVFVASFITDVGEPGVNSLPTGIAERLIHAYQTDNVNCIAKLNFELWKRDLAGTETLLRSGYSEDFSNQTKAELRWSVAYATAFSLLTTDRLVFKIYAARVSGSTSFDVITSYEGADVSYVKTTISAGAVGPQGVTGATGPQGVTGATGVTGANGVNGATGATGATGAQGIQGVTGPVGNYVTSFNGTTGAVTGVTAGGVNTFTQLNSFSGGLSAGGNVVFNAITAVFGASAANTTPITLYKDNSADNPAVDDGFGNTSFDTPNNKVPLTLSFTEVYDPNTGLTASTPGSTMIRVRDQTAGLDTFTVTDAGSVVCGSINCGQITPTSFGGNLSIDASNSVTLNWDGTFPAETVLSVNNNDTLADTLTLKGDGTFSQLTTSGTVSGATGAFSKLLTASGGLSASGATFSGNISAPNIVDLKRGWFLA